MTCQPLLRSGVRCVILATVLSAFGCGGGSPTTPEMPPPVLTPARAIAGQWGTRAPASLIVQTDFCNNANVMQNVATTPWTVTWTIASVSGFTNVVDVEMRHTFGPFTPLIDTRLCGPSGGWVPLVSPHFFRLCLSSDTINPCTDATYRSGYAYGTFTTDQMFLTWYHAKECIAYCWSETTEPRKLELFKR